MNALLLAVAVALECGNPGSWQLSQRAESPETGVEVVTITLRTDDGRPASPPEFRAAWTVPLVDIAHLWTPERGCVSVVSGSAVSKFCANTPVYAFFSESCENRFAFACSEASRAVRMDWRAVFETVGAFDASVSLDFFSEEEAPLAAYEVRLRFDTRRIRWDEAVQGSADWVAGDARGGPTPDAAYDPVYSTWYAFERAFDAATLERECALAAQMGMRTLITDDGWQRTHGDWLPIPEKFPDFRAHVAKVKSLGMRYLLWYALPFMNEKSANYRRFEDKYLKAGPFWEHRLGMLDPRFPEVRKQIVDDLERLMRDYDLDGFKLDFLDSFRFYGEDPARAENFAGRDTKSVPEAAERLMREVKERLTILKPDVLIEFRQTYVGPVACRYGNMLRANDCPGDPSVNRARTTNVRLTAGGRAVHSDMLKWSPADTPESAARSILSVLFTAIQYSMVLDSLPPAHREMVAKWLKFAEAHKETLQKGGFRAYAPQAGYPLLEGWSEKERIFAVYDANFVVPLGRADRRTILVNATSASRIFVEDDSGVRTVRVTPADFAVIPSRADAVQNAPLQVVLTFDDALKDHLLLAAPMLEARGWRGTFSIVTDWVGKNGRHLAWDDVRGLVRRGHEIATHTKSHAFLVTALDEGRTNDVLRELTFSRDEIARQTGILPRILCPPFVQQNAETARLAREAGLAQMDIPRVIFGSNNVNGVTAVLKDAIAQGQRRIDILHHGVSAEDHGGWCAFPTRASFEAHLDAIKRLEDAGKIVVTDYPLPGDLASHQSHLREREADNMRRE